MSGVPGPADYARACIGCHVAGRPAPPAPDDPFYEHPAACFVTLKKRGELRGCIGTLEPQEGTLGAEIARNSRSSALQDPRFPPVRAEELEALTVSVDVLSPSEPCTVDDLDPSVYGVIVEAGFRRGVLLPALAGITSVAEQVGIALQKAGLDAGRPFDVSRFTVSRYREGDPATEKPAETAASGGDD